MRFIPLSIIVSSLIFFTLFVGKSHYRPRHSSRLAQLLPGLPSATSSSGALLWRALITGDDKGMSSKDKTTYYRLGLGHLFTPSGVHLATLNPLLKHLPSLSFCYALMALLCAYTPGLGALGRVAIAKAVPAARHSWPLFATVLLIEGWLFSWQAQPLSWTCSWLFLGLCWFSPQRLQAVWFLIGQMLLCWVFQQPLSLFSPVANLFAALPLALLFPAALLLSALPTTFVHGWLEAALTHFHNSVLWFDQIHLLVPPLSPHFGHVLCGVLWLTLPTRLRPGLGLGILLLTSPLGTQRLKAYSLSRWEIVPATSAVVVGSFNYKASWSDGTKCQRRWKGDGWEENCRPPKRKAAKKTKIALWKR